jgi:hypothetical protein
VLTSRSPCFAAAAGRRLHSSSSSSHMQERFPSLLSPHFHLTGVPKSNYCRLIRRTLAILLLLDMQHYRMAFQFPPICVIKACTTAHHSVPNSINYTFTSGLASIARLPRGVTVSKGGRGYLLLPFLPKRCDVVDEWWN